jgi:tRNA G10  N-methylase Trm11
MPTYFFQLGNTPVLSVLEIEALCSCKLDSISSQLCWTQTEKPLDIDHLQQQSGGLVKTYLQLSTLETDSINEIEAKITDYLSQQTGKVVFSITYLGDISTPKVKFQDIKKQLTQQNIKSRYIESSSQGLSAAVLLHQKVHELVIIKVGSKLVLAKTISVQDIDAWTKIDRSKPYFDRKKGMLPPKVARMMVNIAKKLVTESTEKQPTIYDPFCGSGTILMEAALQGFNVIGSDLDKVAVEGTKQNLEWLTQAYSLGEINSSIWQQDATQALPNSNLAVDIIVTEPFLGKPKPEDHELANIFKGLYRTYLGTFKNWSQMLKPQTPIVIILPLVETKTKTYDLQKLIDKLPQLGYTTVSQPVIYSRPQAVVKRQLNFLRYKG